MCMCTGMCNCVYGRVLGAGAFQTQSWLSWFLLRSRAGGYGAGVHGRSRFRGSGCLWVTAVRRRGRPARPVRRVSCRPYAFCALPLARPCPRRRQYRCSSRRRSPLPAPRRCRRYRHLSPHHGQRCRGLECGPERVRSAKNPSGPGVAQLEHAGAAAWAGTIRPGAAEQCHVGSGPPERGQQQGA